MTTQLIDDTTALKLRAVIGSLLSHCSYAEIAVSHVRLWAVALRTHELSSVSRCRVLLDRLEARSFDGMDGSGSGSAHRDALRDFLSSERVELHSVGFGAWHPDFSLFRGLYGSPDVMLVGSHYFNDPPAIAGPSFTCVLEDPAVVQHALSRFEELWARSHDVRAVVLAALTPHEG